MARSTSRLNSAAPYDTHACPPMSSARTRCARIEERTLSIGLGIKRASQRQERRPKFAALAPSFGRRQAEPLRPLRSYDVLGTNVRRDWFRSRGHGSGRGRLYVGRPSRAARFIRAGRARLLLCRRLAVIGEEFRHRRLVALRERFARDLQMRRDRFPLISAELV